MGKYIGNQRGFTLIEMSIVLVIIGLIIGGILKGQELIESARQKNAISQIDGIKAGVTTFIDKYKSYPGDYGRATTNLASSAKDGNDDGIVGATTYTTVAAMIGTIADDKGTSETVQFWNHMLLANTVGGGSTIDSATNPGNFSGLGTTQSPLPASAFPQSGLSIVYGIHEGTTATGLAKQGHWLIMHRWAGSTALSSTTYAIVSPARMSQLDNKYDDGLPDSGQIRTTQTGSGCGGLSTNSYTATDTSLQCIPMFFLE